MKVKKQNDQRGAKLVLAAILILFFAQGWHWFWSNFDLTFQSPIVLERQMVSPVPKVIKAIDVEPLPTLTITPKRVVSPTPTTRVAKPKKVTAIEVANTFAYQSKVVHMDEGQINVMRKIESTLGHAYAELIFRESGFHPYSVNSSSGACGLGQALPCEKMGCSLTDVDCQLNWIKSYVERRYGSPEKALAFHDTKGWY